MKVGAGQRSRIAGAVTAGMYVFMFAPLLIVIWFSFQKTPSLSLPFTGPSLKWWGEVLHDPVFHTALTHSVLIALLMAVGTLVVGGAAALGVTRSRLRGRGAVGAFLTAPIGLPPLFLGIILASLFVELKVRFGLTTIALAHFLLTFPLFFVIARVACDRMDSTLEDVAADLGARPWMIFRRVVWPQIGPVLIAGAAISFVSSFDSFVITTFVAGSQLTVPVYIFGKIFRTIDPSINVISTILTLMMLPVCIGGLVYAVRAGRKNLDRFVVVDTEEARSLGDGA